MPSATSVYIGVAGRTAEGPSGNLPACCRDGRSGWCASICSTAIEPLLLIAVTIALRPLGRPPICPDARGAAVAAGVRADLRRLGDHQVWCRCAGRSTPPPIGWGQSASARDRVRAASRRDWPAPGFRSAPRLAAECPHGSDLFLLIPRHALRHSGLAPSFVNIEYVRLWQHALCDGRLRVGARRAFGIGLRPDGSFAQTPRARVRTFTCTRLTRAGSSMKLFDICELITYRALR